MLRGKKDLAHLKSMYLQIKGHLVMSLAHFKPMFHFHTPCKTSGDLEINIGLKWFKVVLYCRRCIKIVPML